MINEEKKKFLIELTKQGFCLDDIKEAFDWVKEETPSQHEPTTVNAPGSNAPQAPFVCQKVTSHNGLECVYVSENGVSFCIHPKTKEVPLMTDYKVFKEVRQEVHAIADFDSVGNTRALAEADPESPAIKFIKSLGGDWHIPALGVVCIIGRHVDEINKVLEEIEDAELIDKDEWLWSSTEDSATYAWGLSLSNGYLNFNTKVSLSIRVRPVSAIQTPSL